MDSSNNGQEDHSTPDQGMMNNGDGLDGLATGQEVPEDSNNGQEDHSSTPDQGMMNGDGLDGLATGQEVPEDHISPEQDMELDDVGGIYFY